MGVVLVLVLVLMLVLVLEQVLLPAGIAGCGVRRCERW